LKRLEKFREPIYMEECLPLPHTPKRFLNYLLANLECKMGRLRPISRPYYAFIDPSTVCNLKCPLCPTGTGAPGRSRKCLMKLGDFKKAVDALSECLYIVYLYNWGEPFLNPEIFEMIEHTKSRRLLAFLSSNLNVRIENFGEKVVKSGLDWLYASIDGTDQKTYEGYRRGGSYSLAMSNLADVIEAKKRLGSSTPFIVAGFLPMRHNEAVVGRFKKKMLELGADAVLIANVTLSGFEAEKQYLPLDERLNGYLPDGKRKTPFPGCAMPWTTAFVFPDLQVSGCCYAPYYDEKHDLGNLREARFSELWNSPRHVEMRRVIRDRISDSKNPCAQCVEGRHPWGAVIEWATTSRDKSIGREG